LERIHTAVDLIVDDMGLVVDREVGRMEDIDPVEEAVEDKKLEVDMEVTKLGAHAGRDM
jgi:hypothetical protein